MIVVSVIMLFLFMKMLLVSISFAGIFFHPSKQLEQSQKQGNHSGKHRQILVVDIDELI